MRTGTARIKYDKHKRRQPEKSEYVKNRVIIIIIYHDFLPTPRRGSHVKSGKTHTVIKIHPLAHILDS